MPDTLLDIPLDRIGDRKYTVRRRIDDAGMPALMRSIQRFGVIEPILVTPSDDGYELVVGRRRLEACRRLKLETIPAIVRRMSADRARELSFQSNLQVQSPSVVDEVEYLRSAEVFHLPDAEGAARHAMQPDEMAVAKRVSRLSAAIREAIRTGEIDERRALCLTRLDAEVDQTRAFRYIRDTNPSVEAVEDLVDRIRSGEAPHI